MRFIANILYRAALIFFVVLLSRPIQAQETAYINSTSLPASGAGTTPGPNGVPFSLGLEFTVNSPVIITQLGAYDATIGGSGAGFGSAVQVGIYNVASQSFISPTVTFSGTAGTVSNSYRFQPIASLTLSQGTYMVVASGYGLPTAPLWDEGWANVSPNPIAFDSGNGALSLGRSFYGYAPGGSLAPAIYQDVGPDPQYGAGSFVYSVAPVVPATNTTFTFYIDEPCKTSAGVFDTNGALMRTLWSKVRYTAPGTNTAVWDGKDDNSNTVAEGVYQIKVLQHNTEYVWDGAIGNTSAEPSGPTVHKGFWPMRDMAISGTNAFYVSGYNEGMYDFRSFLTTDPQHLTMIWYWVYSAQFNRVSSAPGDIYDLNWLWAAADSNRVYFACSSTANPQNLNAPSNYTSPGCIVSCNVADNSQAYFANGVQIVNNGANTPLPNGIYVGTQPGLSGLAVQRNGNLLAASVAPDNRVYLMDKVSGAAIANFAAGNPGRMNFSPDGSLWVISGSNLLCFTNLTTSPSIATAISNFAEPLDVAANPTNANIVLVADGGSSQQVKAFNEAGTSLWTYGLAGGYQANGPAVSNNKFWFYNGEADGTFLCFAPDGSFWVGDGGNNRSLHFSASLDYIEQIMYQPRSLLASVDQNNPSRVFNQFLEFNVNYAKPLRQSWSLVNNWKANLDACHIENVDGLNLGIRETTTFTNGRAYALIVNNCVGQNAQELCELATNGMRLTGIFPMATNEPRWISFGADCSVRATTTGFCRWYESTLSGFDTNNNPVWNPQTLLATASENSADPVPRCCGFGNIRTPVSTNNILISLDETLNNGFHLGGVKVGSTNWLWRASPAAQYMNGAGNFEIANGVVYAANTMQARDRQVIFGYHGEFFRGSGQACQTYHYYDDGLFVGQFGESTPGHSPYEGAIPASAANGHCTDLIETSTGDYYLWVNDESSHGPQRWHLANARNIREIIGAGNYGGAITLSNQTYGFPSAVTGKNGYQSGELTWNPVAGATAYNVRYSPFNGGPYTLLAGKTTNLDFVAGGLVNGATYYFAVTAIIGGVEGIPSEQVVIQPFDTSQNVLCAGSMSEGQQGLWIDDVDSTAPALGHASFLGTEQDTGLLNPRELDYYGYGNLTNDQFGTEGYVIYDWGGFGSHITNIVASAGITLGSGWTDIQYLGRQFKVNGTIGVNDGLVGTPAGTINITVGDSNYLYLTVISPDEYNNPRQFTLRLTSTNGSSAAFYVNEAIGYSHVYQFLFKGNCTLVADGTGGQGAIVQAIFLDNAAVTSAPLSHSSAPAPITPTGAKLLPGGGFQFSFLDALHTSFAVLSTTNVALPLSQWTVVGTPTNIAPGQFQFTTQRNTNDLRRYFVVSAQ